MMFLVFLLFYHRLVVLSPFLICSITNMNKLQTLCILM